MGWQPQMMRFEAEEGHDAIDSLEITISRTALSHPSYPLKVMGHVVGRSY